MNGSMEFVEKMSNRLDRLNWNENIRVLIAPPFLYVQEARMRFNPNIEIVGQTCSNAISGAYTGDISASMLLDLGVEWVILGHSERRMIYGETNDMILDKLRTCIKLGIGAIVCVGETIDARKDGTAVGVVGDQVDSVLDLVNEFRNLYLDGKLIIAYEPLWAIGTGMMATLDQIREMHRTIRRSIETKAGDMGIQVIYGGSVTGENCYNLVRIPEVNGILVGKASLSDEFLDIIEICSDAKKTM